MTPKYTVTSGVLPADDLPLVYYMPNDELEQDRLDLSHALMTKAIGDKLFLAPVDTDKMQRVLDIGTGTGICTASKPR